MNGMHADGSKATGFKSMVVAQFTWSVHRKDDRAFVRHNASTGNYDVATAGDGAHLDGLAEYRKGWGHEHIKCSNDLHSGGFKVGVFKLWILRSLHCIERW